MDKQKALQILHLTSNASMEEIKSAYRKRAKKFHPDRFNHENSLRKNAETRMKDINLAFQILYSLADSGINADSEPNVDSGSNIDKSDKSDKSDKKYIKPEKQQDRCGNWSMMIKAYIFFSEIFKKIEREKPVQNEKNKAKVNKYKRRMEKNNYARRNECRISDKKKKLKSFDSMLRKNLKTDINFPMIKNKSIHKSQRINMRIKFFNTRICQMQRIRGKKYFMDSVSGPVQKITPISPVKKIT